MGEINVVAAEPTFADQHRNFGSLARGVFGGSVDHHAGEPWRKRQLPQLLSFLGDAAIGVDGAKLREQGLRFRQRRTRRWIEELNDPRERPEAESERKRYYRLTRSGRQMLTVEAEHLDRVSRLARGRVRPRPETG